MSSSSDERGPVGLLADEFLARCKRGERPTIKEYCDRHPELAAEIRDVFEAVLMVEDLKPGSSDASGSVGESLNVDGKRLEQVGDYRILCEIGRGGMGVVYEAEQQALGRRVALKVLPRTSAGDGSAQIRFQREAKAAARMHHTNIVPVFDVGQDGEHLYYAMQLIHGQGLDQVIEDLKRLRAQDGATPGGQDRTADRSIAASLAAGRFEQENLAPEGETGLNATAAYEGSAPSSAVLPGQSDIGTATTNRGVYFRSVAQIGMQTASALSYAHSRGIIHRDIKPGNLILDTTGNVWVTDFGLAKTGDGGMTHTGDILGTVRYMSPERFRGQCDVRADVYALGMTLYELLTLNPAYASGDRLKLIDLIRHTDAASPRSIDVRIPRDLETIVIKAIDKDPKRRYQSADEMGEDLQRFVNDEPIKARRIGLVERLGRWCRHHPGVASLMAALALILLGVTVASLLAAGRFDALAREQAAAAEKERQARRAADEATEHEAALRLQAEAGFAQARRAVDDYLTTVSESQLLQVPGMQRLRRDLLESALRYYQDFLKERGDDPSVRGELAAAYLRVGRIRIELAEEAGATKAYEKARELYEALVKAAPQSSEWRHGLAQCDFWLGRVDEAIALWEKLVQPNQPRFQKELAVALNMRALRLMDTNRLSEGLQAHQRVLAIREMLVRLNPQDAEAHRDLGGTLNNIGVQLARWGHPAEALAMYRLATRRAEAAFAQSPHIILNGRFLAIQVANVASLERQLGHVPEALEAFRRTADIYRKLANENPAVPYLHSNLWVVYRDLAIYQRELKQIEESESTLRLARGVIDRLPSDGPDALFKLACVRAECAAILGRGKDKLTAEDKAEQKHEADWAMDSLRQAVAAGFRDGERLRKTAELNPLRGREDFKVLEADMATRAGSAPPGKQAADRPAPASGRQPLQADSDQRLQADRAAVGHALALIELDVGKWEEAEEHLGQAIALREALVKAEPKNASYQADLAASRGYLFFVRARRFAEQKRTNEAADALLKAVDVLGDRAEPREPPASEADRLFARLAAEAGLKALTAAIDRNPEDRGKRQQRAEWYARHRRWKEAAADFTRALEHPAPDDAGLWLHDAAALAAAGDRDGYQRLCRKMLDRFGETQDLIQAELLARACLLLPEVSKESELAYRLADQLAMRGTDGPDAIRFAFCKALADYRRGRHRTARTTLVSLLLSTTDLPPLTSECQLVLALALHRLGETNAAREHLTKAARLLDQYLSDPERFPTDAALRYDHDWLIAWLLHREARDLIELKKSPDPIRSQKGS